MFGNTVGFRLLKNLIGKDRTPNQRTASLFRYGVAMSMIILVSMYTDLLKEMFRSASSDDPTENLDDLLRKRYYLNRIIYLMSLLELILIWCNII